jgi:Glycosyl hydrolase catalytic core
MLLNVRARSTWRRPTIMLLVLACFVIQAISATAFANAASTKHAHSTARGPLATAARILPPALKAAAQRSRHADRVLVARAKGVKRCVRANPKHPGRCKSARRALQRAGTRRARIELNLARLASSGGKSATTATASALSAAQQAPVLTVSGLKVSWNKVDNIDTYVYVIKIPGQADHYGIVRGTSGTPPAVPGFTVKYSVRTTANGSAWAAEKSITYPALKAPVKPPVEVKAPEEVKVPVKTPEEVKAPVKVTPQAAPELIVSGQKLEWNASAGVSTYVLATTAPGDATQYSEVSGISFTPTAVVGSTIKYSLRAAVEGALWSPEVSISYPAATPVAPPVETPAAPPSSPSSMWISLNAGGWGASQYADVSAAVNTVRTEEANISGWTKAGVKVIYSDSGPYTTGGVKAVNVSSWVANAVAYIKTNPQVAAIEVLNEASGSWFWGPNAASPEEAVAYDKLLEAVHNALVKEFGSARPLILASYGGPSEAPVWGERLYAANPNIGNFCDGVVVHPYPSSGKGEADRKQVEEAHAKTGKPVYATEVGWSTSIVSEAEQAQDITNFINWAKSTGYVADVDIFGYRDYSTNTSENAWGIETHEGRHKLAYAALAAFPH